MNVKDFLNTVSNQIKYKPVRGIITEELKELESKVLGAEEKVVALEYKDFSEIR